MSITTIFALAGGLGLFLYGMKLMSDGLTNVAGEKLRVILEKMTKNVLMGTAVGLVFTAIIQSSSASTALVVSFVNAGLMNLYQASGIILGANIGTTATGLLMTFNLSEIAPLFVFIGVIMMQFMKGDTVKKVGQIILGFGVLFVGLSSMSAAMKVLKDSPMIVNLLTGLTNPILAVLIGCGITAVLQSASAMVGILIVLAGQGLVSLEMAFYLTLGCNIGCTITAIIASIGGTQNAKRAAAIHLIVNIIGTIVMGTLLALFMPQMLKFITGLTGSATATGAELTAALGKDVAYSNTIFKVFQVVICIPIYKLIVKLTQIIIKDKEEPEDPNAFKTIYLDSVAHRVEGTTAMPLAIKEVERMSEMAIHNLNLAVNSLLEVNIDKKEEILHNEDYIDYLNHHIFEFLNGLNIGQLPKDDARLIGPMFHVISDLERVGDHAKSILKSAETCVEKQYVFTEQNKQDIRELLTMVISELELSLDMFSNRSLDHLGDIIKLESLIDEKEDTLQKNYLANMKNRETSPREGMMYSDVAADLERIGDHANNIAFSILNHDGEEVYQLMQSGQVNINDYLL